MIRKTQGEIKHGCQAIDSGRKEQNKNQLTCLYRKYEEPKGKTGITLWVVSTIVIENNTKSGSKMISKQKTKSPFFADDALYTVSDQTILK